MSATLFAVFTCFHREGEREVRDGESRGHRRAENTHTHTTNTDALVYYIPSPPPCVSNELAGGKSCVLLRKGKTEFRQSLDHGSGKGENTAP